MREYALRTAILAGLVSIIFLGGYAGLTKREVRTVVKGGSANFAWNFPTTDSTPATSSTPKEERSEIILAPTTTAPIERISLQGDLPDAYQVFRPKHSLSLPDFSATVGLIADLATGESYYALRPENRWPIASLTKILSAVVAQEYIPPRSSIALSEDVFALVGDATSNKLNQGEVYSREDLINAMMIFSSNEAAEALAQFEGRDVFLNQMNDLAKEWGLQSTYFSDPTGLSSGNQSTARDLQVLARIVYEKHPEVFGVSRVPAVTLTDLASGTQKTFPNINTFSGMEDFLGGKTGFTYEAQGNLLSLFRHQGRPVVVVVLGAKDRFLETQNLWNWFERNFELTRL